MINRRKFPTHLTPLSEAVYTRGVDSLAATNPLFTNSVKHFFAKRVFRFKWKTIADIVMLSTETAFTMSAHIVRWVRLPLWRQISSSSILCKRPAY